MDKPTMNAPGYNSHLIEVINYQVMDILWWVHVVEQLLFLLQGPKGEDGEPVSSS